MSSGAGCYFTETEPGRWTYSLQRWPYGETDEYDEFGPFSSFGRARKDLQDNHQNPGGYSVSTLSDDKHVHEFGPNGGWRNVGFELTVRVESLGASATPEEVIALIQSLPVDHPALKVRPVTALDSTLISCDSCGKQKEEAS